jgi:cytidylate kinase
MIVVIDGPAGSGKSSTAKAVAQACGLHYLDSGAFYRAITLIYIESEHQKDTFFESLKQANISFAFENNNFTVVLNGTDVTQRIRESEVSSLVSEVAAMSQAREFVNSYLREFVESGNFIADGRDLGTVVFPNAEHKFFLIADVEQRAKRRVKEMLENDQSADFDEVLKNLLDRDDKDSSREEAPLIRATDAVIIDTTTITFEEQVAFIVDRIRG